MHMGTDKNVKLRCEKPIFGPLGTLVALCKLKRGHDGPCTTDGKSEQDMVDALTGLPKNCGQCPTGTQFQDEHGYGWPDCVQQKAHQAEVTRRGCLDIQACVPETWTDEQVKGFVDSVYPCGTEAGWCIRREGDKLLSGDPERVPCKQRAGYVHIMLDA